MTQQDDRDLALRRRDADRFRRFKPPIGMRGETVAQAAARLGVSEADIRRYAMIEDKEG